MNTLNRRILLEEYRLIEKCESNISSIWKGSHLLLFFLAFVFGSFCTFCFHVLMYMFDEKCVLFPKLMALTTVKPSIVYEFIPDDHDKNSNKLPVDFLSTQWLEKSVCYMPTYVPLVSGIFGLVWTTMFLMCTSGSWTLTGFQRPWWVLPFVFIFSLAMGCVCIYSSCITHSGLNELCTKLSEITGSTSCTYTVNVATLVYEKHIRGVYQAIKLTILSAWLHTLCWLLSALLTLLRIVLVIDFQLVKVTVELRGDLEKTLEFNEEQLRIITSSENLAMSPTERTTLYYKNKSFDDRPSTVRMSKKLRASIRKSTFKELTRTKSESHYLNTRKLRGDNASTLSLVPAERYKFIRQEATKHIPLTDQFIIKLLYDLIDSLPMSLGASSICIACTDSDDSLYELRKRFPETELRRQYGQNKLKNGVSSDSSNDSVLQAVSNLNNTDVPKSVINTEAMTSEIEIAKIGLESKNSSESSITRIPEDKRKKIVFKEPLRDTTAEDHSMPSTSKKDPTVKKKEKKD